MSLRNATLHDPYLIGNGRWCSCCFPDGPPQQSEWMPRRHRRVRRGCNECAGAGRIVFTAEEIVAATAPGGQDRRAAA